MRRVAAMDVPVAYYPELEEAILPQSADVLKAIQGRRSVLTAADSPDVPAGAALRSLLVTSRLIASLRARRPSLTQPAACAIDRELSNRSAGFRRTSPEASRRSRRVRAVVRRRMP